MTYGERWKSWRTSGPTDDRGWRRRHRITVVMREVSCIIQVTQSVRQQEAVAGNDRHSTNRIRVALWAHSKQQAVAFDSLQLALPPKQRGGCPAAA